MFERAFKDFGLPQVIRTDNGVPFASPFALYGLSRLAVWWLRLGIQIERIKPGHPEQNGRHERMHLTLKKEATKPAAANVLQQQARFDTFIDQYNQRAAAPGPRDEGAGRGLPPVAPALPGLPSSTTRCTTGRPPSPAAAGFAGTAGRSISVRSLRARTSASARSATGSGWSALWITIWGTSTTRSVGSSRSRIPSARKCYLCLRNELLPMSPEWTRRLARPAGLEPATSWFVEVHRPS